MGSYSSTIFNYLGNHHTFHNGCMLSPKFSGFFYVTSPSYPNKSSFCSTEHPTNTRKSMCVLSPHTPPSTSYPTDTHTYTPIDNIYKGCLEGRWGRTRIHVLECWHLIPPAIKWEPTSTIAALSKQVNFHSLILQVAVSATGIQHSKSPICFPPSPK